MLVGIIVIPHIFSLVSQKINFIPSYTTLKMFFYLEQKKTPKHPIQTAIRLIILRSVSRFYINRFHVKDSFPRDFPLNKR